MGCVAQQVERPQPKPNTQRAMIPVDPVSATSVWPSAPTRTRENRGSHQIQMVYGKARLIRASRPGG